MRATYLSPNLGRLKSTFLVLATVGESAFGTSAFAHANEHSVQENALASPSQTVDCTLEDGTATECVSYVVKYLPEGLEIGPFCPATLEDEGGIWNWDGDRAGLYRINGDFLRMLDAQGYTFFNDEGEVYSFDIRVEGPTEPNECIAGSVDPEVEMTMLIPADPVMADEPTKLGTVSLLGVGLDGVPIFGDAPSVLVTGHMPALDNCGGHVDPGGWYHWHATATNVNAIYQAEGVEAECTSVAQDQTAQFGYAFDGFAMFGALDHDGITPDGLDECSGHIGLTEEGGEPVYHYHAGESFPNLPTCLVGVVAEGNFSTTASTGAGSNNLDGGPGGPGPDFGAMAEELGVDPDLLLQTLMDAGGPNADLNQVAEALDVSVDALREALPGPAR